MWGEAQESLTFSNVLFMCLISKAYSAVIDGRKVLPGVPSFRGVAMMRIVLAQPRGFCAGVVRAIDIVERALEKSGQPVYVRHEIVHNQYVVDALKKKGARFVEELRDIPEG